MKVDTSGLRLLKKKLKKAKVKVGLPKGSDNYKDGTSVIEVGAIHEFGSPSKKIPERSFIRSTINEQKETYSKIAQSQGILIINGKQSLSKALEHIGIWGQREIQKKFTNNDWAKNSLLTIKSKGSSKPLIDTGHLRQSITWSVDND